MNKNKDKYIEAINEIKVGGNVKKDILNKMKEKKSRKPIYAIAGMAIVFVIAISIAIPMRNKNINKQNNPVEVIAEEGRIT